MFDGLKVPVVKPSTSPSSATSAPSTKNKDATIYKIMGSMIIPTTEANSPMMPLLPGKNFSAKFHPEIGFYLDAAPDFVIPKKIYGDTSEQVARLVTTFQDRPSNTGMLLVGDKGGGKSLFAKLASILCADLGIPTIIIGAPFTGPAFFDFIARITQPAVILIDEFEKTYHKSEDQESMLSLLDGVYSGKKLFLLTCNDQYKIDKNMKNRPGRLYYRIDYVGLTMSFIKEYSQDALKDKSRVTELCAAMVPFGDNLNFDMLKAVVEEMNRYPGSVQSHLKLLNVRATESNSDEMYHVKLSYKGIVAGKPLITFTKRSYSPMKEEIGVYLSLEGAARGFTGFTDEGDDALTGRMRARRAISNRIKNVHSEDPYSDVEDDPEDELPKAVKIRQALLKLNEEHANCDPLALIQEDQGKGSKGIPTMSVEQVAAWMEILKADDEMVIDEGGDFYIEFTPDDLVDSSMSKGMFEFKNALGVTLRIERAAKEVPWDARANAYSKLKYD